MKKYLVTISLVLALIFMITSSSLMGVTAQDVVTDSAETETLAATRSDLQSAAAFATQAGRANAQPLDVSVEGLDELALAQEAGLIEADLGEVGFAAGGDANPKAEKAARASFRREWASVDAAQALEEAIEPASVGIYNVYTGNYFSTHFWRDFPYRTIGKLYFRDAAGNNFYCTASVISPGATSPFRAMIVTAAHCVFNTDNNIWYNTFVFVPAERNLVAPYGTFPYVSATVLTNWVNAPNYNSGIRYDVALLRLNNNSAGQKATFYTGWLGRTWNQSYVQQLTIFGYPSNLSSGTRYTYIEHAETWAYSTDILAWGNGMGAGSSGGPLLRYYRPYSSGANNYVNSVFSGTSTTQPFAVGARFSSSNIVLLCNALGC